MGTYKQCPQKYKFQEIDKIKTPKSKEAVFGTLIHSALQYMFSREPLFPTLDQVISHFREGWQAAQEKLTLTPEEITTYARQGENIIKRFYAKNPAWNFNVVDLESRFEVVVEDPKTHETHILAGIMDRIDKPTEDTYEIIDYKTSRKMQSQESADKDLQLSVYHLGLTRRWPHISPDQIKLSLYYLKHNEKITTTRSAEALEQIKERILGIIHEIEERIKTNDFPPEPSVLCGWCGYKPICPAWRHLYEKEASPSKEGAEAAITEFFTLRKTNQETEKRIAELQAKIKSYMEAEHLTRVFGEEGIISKKLQERFAYDLEKVKAVLEAEGRTDIWETLFSPDEKKLKEILKEIPAPIREKIEETKITKSKYETFSVSSKKSDLE